MASTWALRWSLCFAVVLGCGSDSTDDDSAGEGSGSAESTGGTSDGVTASTEPTGGSGSGNSGTTSDGTGVGSTGSGDGFACGPMLVCDPGAEYCERVSSNTGGEAQFTCKALPEACVDGPGPTCECLGEALCGDQVPSCTEIDGGFETECPHG